MKKRTGKWLTGHTNVVQRVLYSILLSLICISAYAENKVVSGTVVDPKGEAIIGASVMVKGTTNGTLTDLNGGFKLTVPSSTKFIFVSFVGYDSTTVSVEGKNQVKISLKESAVMLNEVVAIGYGVAKKSSVTGAIAKISSDNITGRPIADVASAMQGQMAGVEVRTTSGAPGSDITIRVRGAASVNADTDPLYVVDGVPVDNISSLNPNDIESIEVLKDASSSAIYGSRGSNGVIIITTKKGKGKTQIQVQVKMGLQELEKKVDVLSSKEWMDFSTFWRNENYINDYASKGATTSDDWDTRKSIIGGITYKYMPDPRWTEDNYGGLKLIDWQDEFYRKALYSDYQIAASGGTDKSDYRISVGYLNQDGIAVGTNYKRLTLRSGVESKLTDRLTVSLNLAPSYSWSDGADLVDGKDAVSHHILSMCPVAESDAGVNTGANPYYTYSWGGSTISPVAYMEQATDHTEILRMTSSLSLKANIIKGLTAEALGAWNYYSSDNRRFIPSSVASWASTGEGYSTTARELTSHTNKVLVQGLLNYNTEIGKHSISALLGASYENETGGSQYSAATQFPNDALEIYSSTWATITSAYISLLTPERLQSYFGRVQYDYDGRYLANLSLRRDGSSLFGVNNRWGLFPAASLGWNIAKEPFWSKESPINTLKIRGSWGLNGNNSIDSDAALGTVTNSNYSFDGTSSSGYAISSTKNDDLGWEKTTSWDLALDLGLLNNRILLSADYYIKETKDLLYEVSVPAVVGYTTTWDNVGNIENKGIELELNTKNLVGPLKWSTTFNLGYNKDKVKSLGSDNATVYTGYSSTQVLEVGQPLRSFYMYKAVGVYQKSEDLTNYPVASSSELGDVRYKDVNGDGVINSSDKTICGHPSPNFTYGLTNTFKYKNFDLSFLLTAQTGGTLYGLLGRAIDRPGMGGTGNVLGKWRNMWRSESEPGDGKTPYILGNTSSYYDTRWLYSSDFLKIKNLTIGYNLPEKKGFYQSARLYLSAENLYKWDNYDYYSTESNNSSTGNYDYGAYPSPKTFVFGVNFNF